MQGSNSPWRRTSWRIASRSQARVSINPLPRRGRSETRSSSSSSPMPSPLEATIPELQDAMESGQLTSVELVDFYLARIAAYDDAGPELNAFILLNPAARDEA